MLRGEVVFSVSPFFSYFPSCFSRCVCFICRLGITCVLCFLFYVRFFRFVSVSDILLAVDSSACICITMFYLPFFRSSDATQHLDSFSLRTSADLLCQAYAHCGFFSSLAPRRVSPWEPRPEDHPSDLQSHPVCLLRLEKKKNT